jgi:hypothetical protein
MTTAVLKDNEFRISAVPPGSALLNFGKLEVTRTAQQRKESVS